MITIQWSNLQDLCVRLFIAAGLNEKEAVIVSQILIEAELDGVYTHGIAMLPAHIRKLQVSYNAQAKVTIECENTAFAVLNVNNMIGMLSAYYAMQLAIQKAQQSGIALILCNHANTFSAASYYVKMAVNAGMIGIAMSNAPAQMAPLNGKDKLLGTNPLAIGIPGKNEKPFIFDMATSVVAKSKINDAVRKCEKKIPYGWATDLNGQPTNDPLTASKGLVLPAAGAKGFGLSMAIDMIAGVLSNANYLDDVGRFFPIENGCMNAGHAFITINPDLLCTNCFANKIDEYLKRIRTSTQAGTDQIRVPGDARRLKNKKSKNEGIFLDEQLMSEIKKISTELNVQYERFIEQ